jgi:hypothetical protein
MLLVMASMKPSHSLFLVFLALALPHCASEGGTQAGGSDGSASTGSGGSASGTGGAGGTSTLPAICLPDDAGHLSSEAKACTTDDDCTAVPTYSCCGDGLIVGLAKSAMAYRACFQTSPPTGCPMGLGCFSEARTEDFLPAPVASAVRVRCVSPDGGGPPACTTSYDADAGR